MSRRSRSRLRRALAIFTVALASTALACGSDGHATNTGPDSAAGGTTSGGGGKSSGGGSGGGTSGGSGGLASGGVAGLGGALAGGSAGTDSGVGGAINWGPYPSGPYGNNVGDTIADLAWEGFVNETADVPSDQVPYVDYGTDAMRKSGKSYGMIHISAFT